MNSNMDSTKEMIIEILKEAWNNKINKYGKDINIEIKDIDKMNFMFVVDGQPEIDVLFSNSITILCSGRKDKGQNPIVLERKSKSTILYEFEMALMRLTIGNEYHKINNVQEVINITRRAKEDNLGKDLMKIEMGILDRANQGYTNLSINMGSLLTGNESKDKVVEHFRNEGFKCELKKIDGFIFGYKISWGE